MKSGRLEMSIYGRFGVKANINVSEFSTRYGGALMRKAAVEAMDEAAKKSVRGICPKEETEQDIRPWSNSRRCPGEVVCVLI